MPLQHVIGLAVDQLHIPHNRNLVQGIDKVADLVERMLCIRQNSWKNNPDLATIKKTSPADVDICLPSYMADRLAYVQSRINTLAQESLRHHGVPAARSARDTWQCKKMADAPICEACGWGPEDL